MLPWDKSVITLFMIFRAFSTQDHEQCDNYSYYTALEPAGAYNSKKIFPTSLTII